MKLFKAIFFLLCLISVSSCGKKAFNPSEQEVNTNYVKVIDVLRVIQYSVEKAYATSEAGYSTLPPYQDSSNALNHLAEVGVEFNNSFSKKVSGEVSFWVLKGGGSRSKEISTTFAYNFAPIKEPKTYDSKFKSDAEKLDKQSEELVKALSSLGTCLKKYENGIYNLNKIELQVAFKVATTASAGIDFKIGVVGITPEGGLEWGNKNKITLTFEIKHPGKTVKGATPLSNR
jgi:hypothetical protein